MKNRVLIGSLIVTFCAFLLYTTNQKASNKAQIQIINSEKASHHKKESAPKIAADKPATKPSHVTVTAGSEASLVKAIENKMRTAKYQVSVQDLNRPSIFAEVNANNTKLTANKMMKLYILAALYHAEQAGKIRPNSTIKIKKQDLSGKKGRLQLHMAYGIAFLRQAMMQGSPTATNALIRKLKPQKINQAIQKLSAKNSSLTGNYQQKPLGQTTVSDLANSMKNIYQGKLVGHYNTTLLGNLSHQKNQLAKGISGQIYTWTEGQIQLALVSSGGKSFVIVAQANSDLTNLGKAIATWFNKH